MQKNKKLIVGSSILGGIIILVFIFLILNYEKAPDNNPSATDENNEQSELESTMNDVLYDGSTDEETEETEGDENSNLPFSQLNINGNIVNFESGDITVSDTDAQLMFSEDFLKNVLGLPVEWENDVLYIGQQPNDNGELVTYLSDLEYLRLETSERLETFNLYLDKAQDGTTYTVAGEPYAKSVGLNNHFDHWAEGEIDESGTPETTVKVDYKLGNDYKLFKADIGVSDVFKNNKGLYQVKIYTDDKLVSTLENIKPGDFAKEVEVDVSNSLKLSIEVVAVNYLEDNTIVLGNASLQ